LKRVVSVVLKMYGKMEEFFLTIKHTFIEKYLGRFWVTTSKTNKMTSSRHNTESSVF